MTYRLMIDKRLNKCALCGSIPNIQETDGIGDIYCPNRECSNWLATGNYHYSGKFRTKKRDAIAKWNFYNDCKEGGVNGKEQSV